MLEAAVYGVPVLFGPKIENSQEAKRLTEVGGGILVKDKKQLYRSLRILFYDEKFRKECGKKSFNYVEEHKGATDRIINEIASVK